MEGWGPWSIWSVCDADGMQARRRKCLTEPAPGICQGRSEEERVCSTNLEGMEKYNIKTTPIIKRPLFIQMPPNLNLLTPV